MGFDEKFNHICRVSSRLIHRKGFSSTTVRDIAKATGMSLGGLYHYFDNKEDLLFKILRNYMGVMLSHLEKELSSISSPKEQIAFILQRHIHFYIQYFYESKCLLHERECLRGKRLTVIRKQERQYFEICRNVMNRLSKETGCRFIHPNVLTFSFFALVNWIYQWYDPKGPVSPSALAQQLITFFLRGVCGDPDAAISNPGRGASKPLQLRIFRKGRVT
jgi:AcrR family transcriptional regulator